MYLIINYYCMISAIMIVHYVRTYVYRITYMGLVYLFDAKFFQKSQMLIFTMDIDRKNIV